MTDPIELAAEVLELDKAATPGEWCWGGRGVTDKAGNVFVCMTNFYGSPGLDLNVLDEARRSHDDGQLIATYRTAAPELARALIEAEEDAGKILMKVERQRESEKQQLRDELAEAQKRIAELEGSAVVNE